MGGLVAISYNDELPILDSTLLDLNANVQLQSTRYVHDDHTRDVQLVKCIAMQLAAPYFLYRITYKLLSELMCALKCMHTCELGVGFIA